MRLKYEAFFLYLNGGFMQTQLNQKLDNSTTSVGVPALSEYMDYRLFLADFYFAKKQQTKLAVRPYSYAIFSAAADIKSPNYLKMIIENKRNLSLDMVSKFAKACSFNKAQTDEFRLLVIFNQAEDPADRNYALKQLSEYRVEQKLKHGELDRKVFEKVPNWIGWIIYAMVDQEGVVFETSQLKDLLRGKVSESEINEALENLIKSELKLGGTEAKYTARVIDNLLNVVRVDAICTKLPSLADKGANVNIVYDYESDVDHHS